MEQTRAKLGRDHHPARDPLPGEDRAIVGK
jgi:hypothetical protein